MSIYAYAHLRMLDGREASVPISADPAHDGGFSLPNVDNLGVSYLRNREGLVSITNEGGHGLHGEPGEHGCYISKLEIEVVGDGTPWEDDTSLGWRVGDRIIAIRDAKIMGAKRVGDRIAIIHGDLQKQDWLDHPWSSDKGFRPQSREAQIVPGGRMYAWRVINAPETKPWFVQVDDWTSMPDWSVAKRWLDNMTGLSEMPPMVAQWLSRFSDVGRRGNRWSDAGKPMSFVSYYGQATGRFETWNLDPELDLGDVPEGYARHPFVWPAPLWVDGIHNNHYNLVLCALREFYRWKDTDANRAQMAWWLYCRLAQWQTTSALCWSAGSKYRGYQWGEKSDRAGKKMWVGGFPSSFALTTQKQYGRNQIAAAALNTRQGWKALDAHREALLRMGFGDVKYGVRDVFWISESTYVFYEAARGTDKEEFWAERLRKCCKVLIDGRDPETGLWPNFQETPSGVTNTFETCQAALVLIKAHVYGVGDYREAIADVMEEIKDRCIWKGRYPIYRWTPDGIEGRVDNETDHVNGPDTSEFTRPYMMVALGAHALMGNQNSKEIFLKWFPRVGELIDWSPSKEFTELDGAHPLGGSLLLTSISSEKRPEKEVDFSAGKHFNGQWKVASSTFEFADEIGIIHRELTKGGDQ